MRKQNVPVPTELILWANRDPRSGSRHHKCTTSVTQVYRQIKSVHRTSAKPVLLLILFCCFQNVKLN